MRRILLLTAAAAALVTINGCFLNAYSSDPNLRIIQLTNQSEDLRQVELEWARFWFTDHPSHLTPERVDGSIQPN